MFPNDHAVASANCSPRFSLSRALSSGDSGHDAFALPPGADLSTLDPLAQAILDARAAHPGATLADLYDPDLMRPDLRRAHASLDRAVDRLYRKAPFASDRERVEHLFTLYERTATPLLPEAKPRRGRRARKD